MPRTPQPEKLRAIKRFAPLSGNCGPGKMFTRIASFHVIAFPHDSSGGLVIGRLGALHTRVSQTILECRWVARSPAHASDRDRSTVARDGRSGVDARVGRPGSAATNRLGSSGSGWWWASGRSCCRSAVASGASPWRISAAWLRAVRQWPRASGRSTQDPGGSRDREPGSRRTAAVPRSASRSAQRPIRGWRVRRRMRCSSAAWPTPRHRRPVWRGDPDDPLDPGRRLSHPGWSFYHCGSANGWSHRSPFHLLQSLYNV